MSRHQDWDVRCKVYVGNLGNNGSKTELESVFSYYGALKNVWVARNPPGFAFIEFHDPRDAEDAVRDLDGTRIGGMRVRVEMSTGRARDRGYKGDTRSYRDRSRSPRYRRSYSPSPTRYRRSRSYSPWGRRGRRERSYSDSD